MFVSPTEDLVTAGTSAQEAARLAEQSTERERRRAITIDLKDAYLHVPIYLYPVVRNTDVFTNSCGRGIVTNFADFRSA